jgi:hypothetical protein
MNQDGTATNDSDNSSSPAASGSSDPHEEISSAETTPPPQSEHAYRENSKRYSNSSSMYSRSYQSVFTGSIPADAGLPGFAGHYHQMSSSSNRPGTSQSIAESYPEEDPADLAAAVGLLSCSYGTPKSGPTNMAGDIPPVPPLPAKYQGASVPRLASHLEYREEEERHDVDMEDDSSSDDEHHDHRRMRHHDDIEESMFGNMD